MKKKLAIVAIAVAVFVIGATAPVSATSVCDVDTTTFEIWLAKLLTCR